MYAAIPPDDLPGAQGLQVYPKSSATCDASLRLHAFASPLSTALTMPTLQKAALAETQFSRLTCSRLPSHVLAGRAPMSRQFVAQPVPFRMNPVFPLAWIPLS